MSDSTKPRGQFGSKFGFIMAAAGSAIGLGNIWKFPYITGENGGGLFVLIYLVCIALVGVPIMVAEIMIGRGTKKQVVGALGDLSNGNPLWKGVGFMGVLAGFLMLSFYIVVAGWAVSYTAKSFTGVGHTIRTEAEASAATFAGKKDKAALVNFLADRALSAKPTASSGNDAGATAAALSKLKDQFSGKTDAALLLDEQTELRAYITTRRAERDVANHVATTEEAAREAVKTEFAGLSDEKLREVANVERTNELTQSGFGQEFGALASDGGMSTFWAGLFLLATIVIVAGGISGGIERVCKVLMPALLLIIVTMVGYAATQPGFGAAVSFVFKPDAARLKPSGVLEALGHAFFTLSLGMGAMITYGSYLQKGANVITQSVLISALDTIIALLACLMMYPIIFSYGGGAGQGPGLVFQSMPMAFAQMGGLGVVLSAIFFALLVFAALTSAISLLEVVASYFIDMQNWSRKKAAWGLGLAVFSVSLPSAYASDIGIVGLNRNFFDLVDYIVSNWMLPLGGLFVAVFAGWIMPRRVIDSELEGIAPVLLNAWFVLLRFVAPILVIVVLLQKVGVITIE